MTAEGRALLGAHLGKSDKTYVAAPIVRGPLPLRGLYFLTRNGGRSIEIGPADSIPARLLGSGFISYLRSPRHLVHHLDVCARIADVGADAPGLRPRVGARDGRCRCRGSPSADAPRTLVSMRGTADWPDRSFWLREKLELGVEIVSAYSRARWWLWRTDLPRTVSALREAAPSRLERARRRGAGRRPSRAGGGTDASTSSLRLPLPHALTRAYEPACPARNRLLARDRRVAGARFRGARLGREPGRRAPSGGGATLSPHRGDLMPGTGISVSVVVPALNAERTIGQVVRALSSRSRAHARSSSSTTVRRTARPRSPPVSALGSSPRGAAGRPEARGTVAGMQATGDVVLFLDSDAIPAPGFGAGLDRALSEFPGAIVGCARTFTARTSWGWVAHLQGETPYLPAGAPRRTAFVSSYCMAVPRLGAAALGRELRRRGRDLLRGCARCGTRARVRPALPRCARPRPADVHGSPQSAAASGIRSWRASERFSVRACTSVSSPGSRFTTSLSSGWCPSTGGSDSSPSCEHAFCGSCPR